MRIYVKFLINRRGLSLENLGKEIIFVRYPTIKINNWTWIDKVFSTKLFLALSNFVYDYFSEEPNTRLLDLNVIIIWF